MWKTAVINIINNLQTNNINQAQIDNLYLEFSSKLFQELDDQLGYKTAGPKTKKRLKHCKPYWNDELSTLWKSLNKYEKEFLKYKGRCKVSKNMLHQ